jgi:transcriptional regulator with XRE-family HTH domain
MRIRKPADALKAREKMDMSQEELAELLRIPDPRVSGKQAIRRWERGLLKNGLPGPVQVAYEALSSGWRPKGWKGK